MSDGYERLCECGDVVPRGRHGSWCSSWCQSRHEEGLPPQPPPVVSAQPPVAEPEPEDCTCGGSIPSGRRDGFCSSWCKTRDAQGLPAQSPPGLRPPTVLAPVGAAPDGEPPEPQRPRYRQRRRLIADEVEERLREAGMLETWQGAAALDLADSLDWTGGSGSARAALHRELNRQMSELLRGQSEAGSSVGGMRNELAERRARRAGGGSGGA
jgi:hypothetical protein